MSSDFEGKAKASSIYKKSKSFSILKITKLNKYEHHQLIEYCKDMHYYIEKKEKKLKKYKQKIKILTKRITKLELDARKLEILNDSSLTNTKLMGNTEEENDPKILVNDIINAAESFQNENGFVFEPTSGLYYDQKTGYYYNAEYGLYYNGDTGCYYKLNQDTKQFEFHSQVTTKAEKRDKNDDYCTSPSDSEYGEYRKIIKLPRKSRDDNKRKTKSYSNQNFDHEEGEIVSDEEYELKRNKINGYDSDYRYQDIAKKYPPSLRVVVQETNVDKLKVGTLFLITYKGGTLGREGDHDVIIPDINVSKYHLKFTYNESKEVYQCADLGSRNGTILNGTRMVTAKQESELIDLYHGSILQLSQTKLLCHVHPGTQTCELCEPGLIMNSKETEKINSISHKKQLKILQKKYGLENEKYETSKTNSKYNDRAADRRIKIGSSNQHEKTQMASTETAISSESKGFKMLTKLGWSAGDKLGKGSDGLLEPINVVGNDGTSGLGCTINPKIIVDKKKSDKLLKTQQRYNAVKKLNIFNNSDDNSD